MIETAFVMAIVTVVAFGLEFQKLPKWLRGWLSRRHILLDIFVSWSVFAIMGFTIIGIMAAGFISLFITVWLYWYKATHKEELTRTKQSSERPFIRHYTARIYNLFRRVKHGRMAKA